MVLELGAHLVPTRGTGAIVYLGPAYIMGLLDSDSDDDDDFNDDGGCSCADSDGPALFGFDFNDGRTAKPACAFGYTSHAGSDTEDDGAAYDPEYARQTRTALESLLREADDALFGEAEPCGAAPPHVLEGHQWHKAFGCMRARGAVHPALPVRSVTNEAAIDGDAACEDANGAAKSVVSTADHCVLRAALKASSVDISVVGSKVSAQPASADAAASGVCEELFAAHGVLSEPIATHHAEARGVRPSRQQLSEGWCLRRLGLPPRAPAAAVAEGVIQQLLIRCWHAIMPHLAAIPLLVAHRLLGIPQQKGEHGAGVPAASARSHCHPPGVPAPPQPMLVSGSRHALTTSGQVNNAARGESRGSTSRQPTSSMAVGGSRGMIAMAAAAPAVTMAGVHGSTPGPQLLLAPDTPACTRVAGRGAGREARGALRLGAPARAKSAATPIGGDRLTASGLQPRAPKAAPAANRATVGTRTASAGATPSAQLSARGHSAAIGGGGSGGGVRLPSISHGRGRPASTKTSSIKHASGAVEDF